jgi:phenylpyruvate tautomerase PptA (4-oxalocrotonate tautomerase family)
MPLVRISLLHGRSATHLAALRRGVYEAMRETFDVPEDDRFILIHLHAAEAFDCDPHYMHIDRSDDLVVIQITCSDHRSVAQKQAFFQRVADKLNADPGLRREDVFINLVETRKENWSFGNGIAQLA